MKGTDKQMEALTREEDAESAYLEAEETQRKAKKEWMSANEKATEMFCKLCEARNEYKATQEAGDDIDDFGLSPMDSLFHTPTEEEGVNLVNALTEEKLCANCANGGTCGDYDETQSYQACWIQEAEE